MLRLAVAYTVAAYLSVLAFAQDSSAPVCATSCFATKITEAGFLAPSVSATDLAALCETESFTQAYYNCMAYHCTTPDEYQRGVVLGQAVCASVGATIPSAGITGSAAAVLATASSIPVATGTQVSAAASQFSTFLSDISAVVGSTPVTSAYNTPSATSAAGAAAATTSAGASSRAAGAAAAASSGQTSGAGSISPPRLVVAAFCGFAVPLTLAGTLLCA